MDGAATINGIANKEAVENSTRLECMCWEIHEVNSTEEGADNEGGGVYDSLLDTRQEGLSSIPERSFSAGLGEAPGAHLLGP